MAKRGPAKGAKATETRSPDLRKAQEPDPIERKPDGTFAKGVSGCPGGRGAVPREIREFAQIDSPVAYAKVKAIMLNDEHKHQLPAAIAILKMAGVSLTADAQPSAPPPPQPGQVPNVVALEALAGGPSGNLQ